MDNLGEIFVSITMRTSDSVKIASASVELCEEMLSLIPEWVPDRAELQRRIEGLNDYLEFGLEVNDG